MLCIPRLVAPVALALAAFLPAAVSGQAAPRPDAAAVEFFEKKVRQIFVNHCYACHSASTKPSGGLRVDALPGGLRLVYVTPAHQYPLGARLSVPRRRALTAWARDNGVLIAEHLTNLTQLAGKRVEIMFLAINIAGCDGAPARPIARAVASDSTGLILLPPASSE